MSVFGPNETGIRLIPPVAFVAGLGVAWGLDKVLPWPAGIPDGIGAVLGWPVIVATAAFVLWLYFSFRRIGTDYDVTSRPEKLVTTGAFAVSRNPGYVAMVIGTLAFVPVMDNLWVVPATIAATLVVTARVIVKEEALLEELFGEAYLAYKARVRRWL